MKSLPLVALLSVLAVLVGCDSPPAELEGQRQTDEWLVSSYGDDAIKNAIIAQHTLYPYHFIPNGAVLTELGEHDLRILVGHFKRYPGDLNLHRGDEGRELYLARVRAVVGALTKAGVDASRVLVADALPGGEGMASERVVTILRGTEAPKAAVTAPPARAETPPSEQKMGERQ